MWVVWRGTGMQRASVHAVFVYKAVVARVVGGATAARTAGICRGRVEDRLAGTRRGSRECGNASNKSLPCLYSTCSAGKERSWLFPRTACGIMLHAWPHDFPRALAGLRTCSAHHFARRGELGLLARVHILYEYCTYAVCLTR